MKKGQILALLNVLTVYENYLLAILSEYAEHYNVNFHLPLSPLTLSDIEQ
jgi:hypothetical protein